MREEFENVLYHQKLAYKAWLNKAFARGISPNKEISQLVWEMLVTYGEALEDFDSVAEDINKISYDLAKLALQEMPVDEVFKYYRDDLVDAVMDNSGGKHPERLRTLLRFSNIVSTAICEANSDRLKRTIRHRRAERFSQELMVAKKIQSHLLPKVVPSIPGFQFAGRLVPAAEIGGDYWSVKHHIKDGIISLKLADITGHGIAAATLVAAVKFISGGYYKGSKSASEVMQQTNRVLTIETPHEILVSMVYGWLQPDTHQLTIVNAGHAPAFICSSTTCTDLPLTGPLMGISETAEYGEVTYKLAKDDMVFFGSDGIIEAGTGERFGLKRLKELVMGNKDKSADEIADLVVRTVVDYAKQPQDDISLLIVKVTEESRPEKKRAKGITRTRGD